MTLVESDSRFFERHPERKHRVRYATRAEIRQLEIAGNKPLTMPPDCRLYVIVRSITSGYCQREFIPSLKSDGTDVDEDLAGALFETLRAED